MKIRYIEPKPRGATIYEIANLLEKPVDEVKLAVSGGTALRPSTAARWQERATAAACPHGCC